MEQTPEDDQLSNLPTITDCSAFPVVLYEAHCLFKDSLLPVLSARDHFQARPTDIFLASLPKSGMTWLKTLTFSSLYRTSLPDLSDVRHPLRISNPHDIVPLIEIQPNLDHLSSFPSPRLLSTHVPFNLLPTSIADSGSKIIYICRNPKDNFVSAWHFWNRMREKAGEEPIPLEASFDQFCDGVSVMGPYWNHVVGYWNATGNDAKVLFVKYEDMIADPISELKRVADFMGCPFTEEEEKGGVVEGIVKFCGFENLSNLEVSREGVIETMFGDFENKFFFRRGGVGGWRSLLSPEMARRLDEITASEFAGTGLSV